ncbi:MAG TPA: helix-turn-helix domain-containing protein [Vicinamibacterales bacterium]|nr:helix-turn-helix domain-containing protein [Vicinamibacterales bacterium]
MHYREFHPSAPLAPFVERFWWLEGPAGSVAADPIPPDGRVEIILHAGDPFVERAATGALTPQARVLVAGQATRAVDVRPEGHARVLGARLRPHAARLLTGVPAHELTDRICDLGSVAPALASALACDVLDRPGPAAMVAAFDAVLQPVAARAGGRPPSPAVDLALRSRGLCRVDDLAVRVGSSPRQLERAFRDHVGLSPKQFLRIVRFQEVLGALSEDRPDVTWATLAAEHGFYDQAHLIGDFRAFLGMPPGAWNVKRSSLAAVFSALGRDAT